MSTTVRPSTAVDMPTAAATQAQVVANRISRRRSRLWIVAPVLLVLGVGGWRLMPQFGPAGVGKSVTVHRVERRSFAIVEEVKGELKAAKTTEVKSKVEGRATIIWVIDEGTTVEEGDLLVRLASDKIEDRIRQEEAKEASAIAGLEGAEKGLDILVDQNASDIRKADLAVELGQIEREKYVEGDAKNKLMGLELDLEAAQQRFEQQELDCEAVKSLHQKRFKTRSELLAAEFNLHEAQRQVEKSKLALATFNTYEYPKELRQKISDWEEAKKEFERVKKSALAKEAQKRADVEAKRANLLNTQTQLKKLRQQLADSEIRAPGPGLVVYYSHRWDPQKITEGSEVHERQTLVTLPDTSLMVVSVRIHEAKTYKIALGQAVNVEIDAIPGRMFTGKITKIAPLADSRNQWLNPDLKEYETEITLDQNDPALKPGVTARAEIVITHLEDVICVPLQAVYSKGGQHYVFRSNGGDGEPVRVTLGESSNELVEIKSGLEENAEVLLAVSDIAKAALPDVEPSEGRRHEGKKARRDEGTKGRRHEGTEARRDEGKKARRDEES
ncbi:MAG: efflux RND transporter periplasmic adaptor subunit [Phycisphaerae bacterium]